MGTKINTDYYGAENTWNNYTGYHASNVKYTANNKSVWNLKKDGVYNGGSLDLSASPWGIGESSISSNFIGLNYRTQDDRIKIMKNFNTRKNTPLLLFTDGTFENSSDWQGGETSPNDYLSQYTIKSRLNPNINCGDTSPETISTLTVDNNTLYQRMFAYPANTITAWDYQKSRVRLNTVWWRNKTTGAVSHDNLIEFIVNSSYRTATEDIEILGVTMYLGWQYGTPGSAPTGNESDSQWAPTIDGVEVSTPEIYKQIYYGENINRYTPFYKKLLSIGYWRLSNRWSTSSIDSGNLRSYTYYDEPKATPYFDTDSLLIGNVSEKHQVFNDVSYHWEIRFAWNSSNNTGSGALNLEDGDIAPNTGYFLPYCALVIDSHSYSDIYRAAFYALVHEACFLGLPVVANTYDYPYAIGANNWVFLPKFDEHLVTTGDFTKGTATQTEINYSWGNIFDDGMPEYDPDYQPPEPEPEEGDTGDLDNQQLHSLRYNGSNNYYLLTESELSQFIGFINGLYTGESDPEKKRSIDFMGSNPTDYIVGIYGCGIELTGGASTSIKLGAVDTADAGIYGRAVPTNLTYVNFGNYNIPAYGNFLDFKPYTTIEVYVPLCGTIEVDPAEYVGHNLRVDGLIDYQTGELTARIVRDGKTVTNTLSGSMWVQLPVTAAKMGDYQNNQHQLRMQMLSSVLSFGQSSANAINSDVQSAAGAIAGSAAGGSPTALATPGKAQFTIPQNAASTALSLYNTHYQITHTQPARATASSASSGNALEMYHHAMIFIKRPTFLQGYNQAEYAHTIGHACCINGKISDFAGYTVISAADLDDVHTKRALSPLQASAQEKQLLKQAMQAGFYINTISPE